MRVGRFRDYRKSGDATDLSRGAQKGVDTDFIPSDTERYRGQTSDHVVLGPLPGDSILVSAFGTVVDHKLGRKRHLSLRVQVSS